MKSKQGCPLWGKIVILIGIIGFGTYLQYLIFNKLFSPYYKVECNNEFLGYYYTKEEFYNLYNEVKTNNSHNFEIVRNLIGVPQFQQIYLKPEIVDTQKYVALIDKQLSTTYIIYKINIDNTYSFYLPRKEDAENYKNKYLKEWKKAKIEIEALEQPNLDLLTSQTEIQDLTKRVAKKYYVASRSGLTIHQIKYKAPKVQVDFISPTKSHLITSHFGMRTLKGVTKKHTGVDIGTPLNSPVYASAAGTVIYSGWCGNYGNYIKIDHGNGVVTGYAHNNELLFQVGDKVAQGDIISLSGSTGFSTGPHLHFEIIIKGVFYNPLKYVKI